ncbi:chromosome replication initiation inhibitor protein, partial [Alcaligenes faecalis subsp. faecalis NCIB 8687]
MNNRPWGPVEYWLSLPGRFIRQITDVTLAPPIHYLPTSTGFVKAAALGLGWGIVKQTSVVLYNKEPD